MDPPAGFDVFISYARMDDEHGFVTALRDQIEADSSRIEGRPLRVFFDQKNIAGTEDWRARILSALRSSKVVLACLSPRYFASTYCRWEWQEHSVREARLRALAGGETLAPVRLADISDVVLGAHDWAHSVLAHNAVDLRPCFRAGPEGVRSPLFRERVARLGDILWQRIEHARRSERKTGNLPRMNPYFVGRTRQLAELNRLINAPRTIGVVTTVHGLGGLGKTELSIQYAHAFRDLYGAGTWQLRAEGAKDMLLLLATLATDPEFGFRAPSRTDRRTAGREVLTELRRRCKQARAEGLNSAVLLLLDNVSDARLLSEPQIAHLPDDVDIHLLATSRLGDGDFAPTSDLCFLELDELTEDESVALIREHQPAADFPDARYAADCRSIATLLDGFTLAVEQVAIMLGSSPEISPAGLLTELTDAGAADLDLITARQGEVTDEMRHPEGLLNRVLESTLSRLSDLERLVLRLAAVCSPETVPWPWLKVLAEALAPNLMRNSALLPDGPWPRVHRVLVSRRLINSTDKAEIGRMHRLVRDHLRRVSTAEEVAAVDGHLLALEQRRITARTLRTGELQRNFEQRILDLAHEGMRCAASGDVDDWLERFIRLPPITVLEEETTNITVLARVSHQCSTRGHTEAATKIARSLLTRCTNLIGTEWSIATEYKIYRYTYGCDVSELRGAVEAATRVARAAVAERDEAAARDAMAVIAAFPGWGETTEVSDAVREFVQLWPPDESFLAQEWLRASGADAPTGPVAMTVADLVDWQVRTVLPAFLFWAAPELQQRARDLAHLPSAYSATTAVGIQDLGRALGVFDAPETDGWSWMRLGVDGLVAGTRIPGRFSVSDSAVDVMAALGDVPDSRLGAGSRIGIGTAWGTAVWLMTRSDGDSRSDPNPWTTLLDCVGETIREVLASGLARHRRDGVTRADDLHFLKEQMIPQLRQDLVDRITIPTEVAAGQVSSGL